jgi:hypothetical protein
MRHRVFLAFILKSGACVVNLAARVSGRSKNNRLLYGANRAGHALETVRGRWSRINGDGDWGPQMDWRSARQLRPEGGLGHCAVADNRAKSCCGEVAKAVNFYFLPHLRDIPLCIEHNGNGWDGQLEGFFLWHTHHNSQCRCGKVLKEMWKGTVK